MATGIHKSLLIPPIGARRFPVPGAAALRDTSEASIPLQRRRGCSIHRARTAAVRNRFRPHVRSYRFLKSPDSSTAAHVAQARQRFLLPPGQDQGEGC
jgi:hypothetical protein